jgi:hypothetical protein
MQLEWSYTMAKTEDSITNPNNIIRFPGTTFETPASTDRKPAKRAKTSPALSPEDAALLEAFHRLSEYGRKIAASTVSHWARCEAIEVECGKSAWNAWRGIG